MIAAFLDETQRLLRELDQGRIAQAREILMDCYRREGRIYTRQRRYGFHGAALCV